MPTEIVDCRICQTHGTPYANTPATADTPPVPLLKCPHCGYLWKTRPPQAPLSMAGEVASRGYSIQHAAFVRGELPESMTQARTLRANEHLNNVELSETE